LTLVNAASAAGENIDEYVYLQFPISELWSDIDFGAWPGIEVGTEPYYDNRLGRLA